MKQQILSSSSVDLTVIRQGRMVMQYVTDGILSSPTATYSPRAINNVDKLPLKALYSSALRLFQFAGKWQGEDFDQCLEEVRQSRSGITF